MSRTGLRILRLALAAVGLSAAGLCLAFMARPDLAAPALGLAADGPLGLSTLRGDMAGMFALIAYPCFKAALDGRRGLLGASALLLAVILVGRMVGVVLDGSGGVALPMIGAEVVMLAIVWTGERGLRLV